MVCVLDEHDFSVEHVSKVSPLEDFLCEVGLKNWACEKNIIQAFPIERWARCRARRPHGTASKNYLLQDNNMKNTIAPRRSLGMSENKISASKSVLLFLFSILTETTSSVNFKRPRLFDSFKAVISAFKSEFNSFISETSDLNCLISFTKSCKRFWRFPVSGIVTFVTKNNVFIKNNIGKFVINIYYIHVVKLLFGI